MIFVECQRCKKINEYCCGKYWYTGESYLIYFRHLCKYNEVSALGARLLGAHYNTMIPSKEFKKDIICKFQAKEMNDKVYTYASFDKNCGHKNDIS